MGDEDPDWEPKKWEYELWGSKVLLEFPTVKLLDYEKKWEELEQSDNPFAVVVMAHLQTGKTRGKPDERYEIKWRLIRSLYERGYSREQIQALLHFIDWLMRLPSELEQQLRQQVFDYQEEQQMRYVTSFERLAIEETQIEMSRKYILEILEIRFSEVPKKITELVEAIDELGALKILLRNAVIVDSLKNFQLAIPKPTPKKPLEEVRREWVEENVQ